jgi:hypothetical protein
VRLIMTLRVTLWIYPDIRMIFEVLCNQYCKGSGCTEPPGSMRRLRQAMLLD